MTKKNIVQHTADHKHTDHDHITEQKRADQEHTADHSHADHSHADHSQEDHNHADHDQIDHDHAYGHYHENTRQVVNRLSRAIGHLNKVKQMVEDGEDCSEVLIQLAAVKAALNNTGKVILKDHIDHCVVHAIEDHDTEELNKLSKAIDQFLK